MQKTNTHSGFVKFGVKSWFLTTDFFRVKNKPYSLGFLSNDGRIVFIVNRKPKYFKDNFLPVKYG